MPLQTIASPRALAHGALAAGVKVVTSYPGSPSSETVAALIELAGRTGCTSSGRATRRSPWRSASARRSPAVGRWSRTKSVGMNVMIDPLMALNLTPVHGGLVILLGDDPGGYGSQNDQDTRPLAPMLEMPWLEPATPAEGFAMMRAAFDVSEQLHTAVVVRDHPELRPAGRGGRHPRRALPAARPRPGPRALAVRARPPQRRREAPRLARAARRSSDGPTRRPSTGSKGGGTSASSRPGSPIASCSTCSATRPGATSASSSWASSSPAPRGRRPVPVRLPRGPPARGERALSGDPDQGPRPRPRDSGADPREGVRPYPPRGGAVPLADPAGVSAVPAGLRAGPELTSKPTRRPSARRGRTTAPAAASGRSSMR